MNLRRCLSPFVMLAALMLSTPGLAQVFPAGEACDDFDVNVDAGPGHGANFRVFEDEDGNLVRILITGTSPHLVITNLESGKSYTLVSKGQRQQIKFNDDGTTTIMATGHTMVQWASVDDPSSELIAYIGYLEILVDEDGIFHLVKATGRQIDICAILE
jgi:hypothetical protein